MAKAHGCVRVASRALAPAMPRVSNHAADRKPISPSRAHFSAFLGSLERDQEAMMRLSSWYKDHPEAIESVGELVAEMLEARGRVLTTGIGKSGYVARRMAASLASIGVPAHFVHGTEWVHGDLGAACKGDIVVSFSHSGNTEELAVLPGLLKERGVTMACIVGSVESALGKTSDHVVLAPADEEILGKIPSRSIIAQEAVVNAIVSEAVGVRSFTQNDFVTNHPGGAIGAAFKNTNSLT